MKTRALICAFVFANADCLFCHVAAHRVMYGVLLFSNPPPTPRKRFPYDFFMHLLQWLLVFIPLPPPTLFLDNDIDCGVCTCKRDGTISCEKDAECQGLYIILNDTFNAIDGDFTML